MNFKRIGSAIAVAGTLDIGSAILLTASKGQSVVAMLQSVASGPFGNVTATWGAQGALLGLATHFAIMTVIVLVFALTVERSRFPLSPLALGPVYGVLVYLVMYWIVLPLRWPSVYPLISLRGVLIPVAIHILLVGLPIALILTRSALGVGTANRSGIGRPETN